MASSFTPTEPLVTACIPHFRCQRYVARAVESLLNQTHRNIHVMVVNDGDPNAPWKELAHIQDSRLVRFSLGRNRGPYFAAEVALRASSSSYFLIQDADDWSAPRRVECLLRALQCERSDLAVSAEPQFVEDRTGNRITEVRWNSSSRQDNAGDFIVHKRITPAYKYRAPHHGLFRSSSLRAIGGYYGGLRISYDTLVPNLILMVGGISHVPERLYYRLIRRESLTHGEQTGIGSPHAMRERYIQRRLYEACFACYREYVAGRLTAPALALAIRRICGANVTQREQQELTAETNRLTELIRRAKYGSKKEQSF